MSSKKVMMMSWKGLARPRTAPMVMRAAAPAKSEPTMLQWVGEGKKRRLKERKYKRIKERKEIRMLVGGL